MKLDVVQVLLMVFQLLGLLLSTYMNLICAKTLFATHYHELNKMSEQFDRIKNFNVAVKEIDNEIVFLRKLKVEVEQALEFMLRVWQGRQNHFTKS